ncbi:iron-containing alcohol dehydrogenase [Dethiobacter alkaliphilus]|uniref:iron-containing alcohol dehydrogenase n=1 Tax=Dethiobacter alkaliphilus TaxID=427926 RepID=UPI0022271F19|nr:iron-containing alcohol dehydrogenase [Dethiobacter alkaliphilus]MCW3489011.1 iron-containing alcohol dehydrogenase [Dethiobacter alkaliphilus]
MPTTIYAGKGAFNYLGAEVKKRSVQKTFLVTDKGLMATGLPDRVKGALEEMGVDVFLFDEAEPEPSMDNLEKAISILRNNDCDFVVAVGGGSAMDVAKASAVLAGNDGEIKDYVGTDLIPRPGIPCIVLPTTAGTGSEVTKITIFLDKSDGVKKGIVSEHILPKVAIVDPDLTLSLPPAMTAATGMDALTHAIEAYTSPNATPHTDLYAIESIRLIGQNLRRAYAFGTDDAARYNMCLGSLYAGIAFANAGVAAVHALAYPLGGRYHVGHGIANAMLLPFVMEFNAIGELDKFANVAKLLGVSPADKSVRELAFAGVQAVKDLSADIGISSQIRTLGVAEEDIDSLSEAAILIERLLANNPRKVTVDDIKMIYKNAF